MELQTVMKKLLMTLSFVFLLLSAPVMSAASEGPAWFYLLMTPFTLLSTPFFLTTTLIALAVFCFWQYRIEGKKPLGIVVVLVLLLAIPTAFREKVSFVAGREARQRAEETSKRLREARRTGSHVSLDFKAMSTANAAKYAASGKTEKDRLNFQYAQDMVRMARTIDAMQQKEPRQPDPAAEKEEAAPVRTWKTYLFELSALILLGFAGWSGAFVSRWRTRRRLTTLVHSAPLCFCLFMPVIAQLPFRLLFAEGVGGRVYFSWLAMLGVTPMSFIVAYLVGILCYHWRALRNRELQVGQTTAKEPAQSDIRQAEPVDYAEAEEFVYFACPMCNLPGRIAASSLPERGLAATCHKCAASFPVRRAKAIVPSRADEKTDSHAGGTLQKQFSPEADSAETVRHEESNLPQGRRQHLTSLAVCLGYFLLQIAAIMISWQHDRQANPAPLIQSQLLIFALPALLACLCMLATRHFHRIVAPLTGAVFALTTATTVYYFQVAANKAFPLEKLVTASARQYALMALLSGLAGVVAGWFFVAAERSYGLNPQALFTAAFRQLRRVAFLIVGWCTFLLIEGLMSPHFHGDEGLIVLPIVAVVDNLPFFVVWLLARADSRGEIPAARLAAALYAGLYVLLTLPLHSAGMILNPVAIMFQTTPFIGLAVMGSTLIALAWFRTCKVRGEPKLLGISSLLPSGRYMLPVRSSALAVAVVAACYGSYIGSRDSIDPLHLFIPQNYPEIVFTDPDGKPLPGLPVSVERVGGSSIAFLSFPTLESRRVTLETDARGILHLPPRAPRLKNLGIAGLFTGRQSIYLSVLDLRWQLPGSGLSSFYELRDLTAPQTVACQPADLGESLKYGSHLIGLMPAKTWEVVVATLESSAGSLNKLRPPQLVKLTDPCNRLISTTCDLLDAALLNHPETPELVRNKGLNNFKVFAAVTRSGNYAEPVLIALEQDSDMASWMELLRKEMRLEAQAKSTAAKADGRTAAVVHEEALKLHKQGRHAEAFAIYQAVFSAPGPMLPRYYGNSSYACSTLGMRAWAMRLAREGLRLKPDHDRSAHSYAQEAFHFADYEAAKLWAKASVATGFTGNDVYKLLGAASMEAGDRQAAAACLWRPQSFDKSETWITRNLERLGPRQFWQPIPDL